MPSAKNPKRVYKEAKTKKVLKDLGHKASDVDAKAWSKSDDAKTSLRALLKITAEQWQGCGMG